MQQALYRKYRPGRFVDLVGQEPIKLTLANQVRLGKVGHAYLFSGPKGTGKTTMARVLAKAVNCLNPTDGNPCNTCDLCVAADSGSMIDLIEMDAASHTGVDDVREVINGVYTAPAMAKYKVYVIDEAHMLSKNAFNALLKTLEEPPAHVIFILASTEVEKFPPTIVSRCQRFDFRPIDLIDMQKYLHDIAGKENIDITTEALGLIAQQSGGGMRDALSLLERAANVGSRLDAKDLREWFGWLDWHSLLELSTLTARGEVVAALGMIAKFNEWGIDPMSVARQWTELVSQLLLVKSGAASGRSVDEDNELRALADGISAQDIVWWLEQMLTLPQQVRTAVLPQLPFELMVVKVASRLSPKSENLNSKQTGNHIPEVQEPERTEPAGDLVEEESGLAGKQVGETAHEDSGVATDARVAQPQAAVSGPEDLDWEAVVAAVQAQSPTYGAVLSAANWQVEGDKIVVMLASNFHKDRLEQPATRDLVLGILAAQGVNLSVEYRIDQQVREATSEVDPSKILEVFG